MKIDCFEANRTTYVAGCPRRAEATNCGAIKGLGVLSGALRFAIVGSALLAGCTTPPQGPADQLAVRSPDQAPSVGGNTTSTAAAPSSVGLDDHLDVPLADAADAADARPMDCPPLVTGAELEKHWPEVLGEVVQLRAEIVRSLDVASVLAEADGARFVVLVAPDAHWRGADPRWFSVLGASSVEVGGLTRLPQLMFTQPEPCRTPNGAAVLPPATKEIDGNLSESAAGRQ